MTTTKTDSATTGITTPPTTGQSREEQQKILQLAMQYLAAQTDTMRNPRYLESRVGEPKPSPRFLRLPEQSWELFYKVDVPVYLFSSDKVPPDTQAQSGNMTTAAVVIGVEIGRRDGVYSVERHFLSVDKNDVFDTSTQTGGGSISDWHS